VTNYTRCLAFHVRIGDAPPAAPARPEPSVLELRRALIREEAGEALTALGALAADPAADVDAAARELADLLYVTYGTFVALGVDADEVFAEVDAANRRKTGGARRADGKQLKPDGWSPPDVAQVLRRQRRERSQGRALASLASDDPADDATTNAPTEAPDTADGSGRA
jgi:predicted HAD superfamily Cof-like phosphohydrolase